MQKANMIYQMKLFTTEGVCHTAYSRKGIDREEMPSGMRTYEASPPEPLAWSPRLVKEAYRLRV